MSEKNQSAPVTAIWTRMAQNTNVVAQMPEWVKGSPVNHRAAAAGASESATAAPTSGNNNDQYSGAD